MRFGINFFPAIGPEDRSPAQYYDELVALAQQAEESGYEHVQTVEHYGFEYGGYSPDPTVLLTALAMRTRTIRLVTGAALPAFHHPVQLASRLALLDNLSGGRLDVGFGRAFLPDEFDTFGVSMDDSRSLFDEGVAACKELWAHENVEWSGRHHRFGPITILPRPWQRPTPPVYVAAATSVDSCRAAGLAGHHLQSVPGVVSAEVLSEMFDAHRIGWREAGRVEADRRVQLKITCYVQDDRAHALALAERFEQNYFDKMLVAAGAWGTTTSAAYPGYDRFVEMIKSFDFSRYLVEGKVLAGDPHDVAAQVMSIRERLGEDVDLSLQFNPGQMTLADSRRSMELFTREIKPSFETSPVLVDADH